MVHDKGEGEKKSEICKTNEKRKNNWRNLIIFFILTRTIEAVYTV